MGLFAKKPELTRAQRRAETKLRKAEAKASKQEKKAKKASNKAAKSANKTAKSELSRTKVLSKMQGKSDKNELKIAEANARAAVNGKLLSEPRIKRYLSTARLLAPVVVPLVYRAAQVGRNQLDSARATKLGVPVDEVANFAGYGGGLSARVAASRRSLDKLVAAHPDAETKAFTASVSQRLDDLSSAVTASESMPPARRRPAHQAISRELDGIDADLLNRLGVSS